MINLKLNKFILIDKPVGWTSFDVVAYIRKITRKNMQKKNPAQGGSASGGNTCPVKSSKANLPHNKTRFNGVKVGHAGTLDPFATGLLIVGVGRQATRKLDEIKNLPKTYEAVIRLGAISDTDDCTGTLSATGQHGATTQPTLVQIKKIL